MLAARPSPVSALAPTIPHGFGERVHHVLQERISSDARPLLVHENDTACAALVLIPRGTPKVKVLGVLQQLEQETGKPTVLRPVSYSRGIGAGPVYRILDRTMHPWALRSVNGGSSDKIAAVFTFPTEDDWCQFSAKALRRELPFIESVIADRSLAYGAGAAAQKTWETFLSSLDPQQIAADVFALGRDFDIASVTVKLRAGSVLVRLAKTPVIAASHRRFMDAVRTHLGFGCVIADWENPSWVLETARTKAILNGFEPSQVSWLGDRGALITLPTKKAARAAGPLCTALKKVVDAPVAARAPISLLRDQIADALPSGLGAKISHAGDATLFVSYTSPETPREELVKHSAAFFRKFRQPVVFYCDINAAAAWCRRNLPAEIDEPVVTPVGRRLIRIEGYGDPKTGKVFDSFCDRVEKNLGVLVDRQLQPSLILEHRWLAAKMSEYPFVTYIPYSEQHPWISLRSGPSHKAEAQAALRELQRDSGREVKLRVGGWMPVEDTDLVSRARELTPEECEFKGLFELDELGRYRIVVGRNPAGLPLEAMKRELGLRKLEGTASQELLRYMKGSGAELPVRSPRQRNLRKFPAPTLTCLGSCGTIGGSAFLATVAGNKVLLDCGQDPRRQRTSPISAEFAKTIDITVVTHGHQDHIGDVPVLCAAGYNGPIFMTRTTAEMAPIVLFDQLRRSLADGIQPLPYTSDDIVRSLALIKRMEPEKRYSLRNGASLRAWPSGHLPGGVTIEITDGDRRTVYSSDILRHDTRLMKGGELPEGPVDTLILETTYGARVHSDPAEREKLFLDKIAATLANGGQVLVPVFRIGRAQNVLLALASDPRFGEAGYPIYTAGSIDAMNEVVRKAIKRNDPTFSEFAREHAHLLESGKGLYRTGTPDLLDRLKEPAVIVATSGMCEGPARDRLIRMASDPKSLVLFTGYQAPGTTGYELLQPLPPSTERPPRTILGPDGPVEIRMQIDQVSFSGHADQPQLLDAVDHLKPKRLVLVHGERESMDVFAGVVRDRHPEIDVIIPAEGEEIPLF